MTGIIMQLIKLLPNPLPDTCHVYDAHGVLWRSGLDLDANGSLDLASADRITEMDRSYLKDPDGSWFERSTTTVYPDAGFSGRLHPSEQLDQQPEYTFQLERKLPELYILQQGAF